MSNDARIELLEKEVATLRLLLAASRTAAPSTEEEAVARLLGDRMVLENVPDVVSITNREYRILYLNRTVPGRRTAEFVGRNLLETIPEAHRARFTEAYERAWVTAELVTVEFQTNSDYFWESRLVPVKDDGHVLFMLCTASDVTARKRAELALRDSESRLRHAVEASGMGTWTWDRRADAVTWDARLCEIFGLEPHEAPRNYAEYLALLHAEERDGISATIGSYVDTGVYEDLEHRVVRKNGEVRWVLGKATPILDERDEVIGFRGGLLDVTQKKRLEEQLQQVQKMEAIGQLTAGIAHNFNNLLGIILPNAALCRMDPGMEDDQRLADIEYAAERAAEMVRQLMLFARPETTFEKRCLDLVASVRRTVDICRSTFGTKATVELSVQGPVPDVFGHPGQIEQALLNICINARDAVTERVGSPGKIAVHVEGTSAGRALVRVTDDGPGMDEATRLRVFEPFFTTKAIGRGTGLGLASAYAIVTDHHGKIRCQSRPGEGATFEIELPGTTSAPAPAPARSGPPAAGRGGETVLIVDDEPLVRRAVRTMLERTGFEVLEAEDGATGLALVERERARIGAVILDRSMPGMSGDEVLAALSLRHRGLPVVVLSGFASSPEELRPAVVLAKPTDAKTLVDALRVAITAAR